jgi:hypothetical protein
MQGVKLCDGIYKAVRVEGGSVAAAELAVRLSRCGHAVLEDFLQREAFSFPPLQTTKCVAKAPSSRAAA